MKNQFLWKSKKKLFQSNCFNRPRSVDVIRSVSMIKVIKFPYLEKRRKKHLFGYIFQKNDQKIRRRSWKKKNFKNKVILISTYLDSLNSLLSSNTKESIPFFGPKLSYWVILAKNRVSFFRFCPPFPAISQHIEFFWPNGVQSYP